MDCEAIKLERPLFYNNLFGLRFEIGPSEIGVWTDFDQEKLNNEYFNLAFDRAVSIYEAIFTSTDEISLAYQIFSDGRRKIKKGNYICKQVNDLEFRKVSFTHHKNLYAEDLEYKCNCWHRVTISDIKVKDVNAKNIFTALINTDFGLRHPSIKGECFFINHSKGIVLNLYDDRGMDVVSIEKANLLKLYRSHNEWILEYDREKIDHIFSTNQ